MPAINAVGGTSERTQSREKVNYEVSETKRERRKQAGEIKKISVAALVDGVRTVGPDGTETWAPRTDEELAALQDLIKSAIGFNEERGDVVTVQQLEFTNVGGTEELMTRPSLLDRTMDHAPQLIQAGILGLILLLVVMFVVRPILQRNPMASELPGTANDLVESPLTAVQQLEGGQAGEGYDPQFGSDMRQNDPNIVLKDVATKRPEEATALLKSWVASGSEQEEPA